MGGEHVLRGGAAGGAEGVEPAHLRPGRRDQVLLADGPRVAAAHRRDRRAGEHAGDARATSSATSVTVVRDYRPGLPRIEAYAGELNQVWTNLIDNAVDAMDGAGTLRLAARAEDGHVVVEIGDTGPGMPPEVAARAFEAFFTTKDVGQGTGLGLDIAQRIVVERHGGTITIDSRPGETILRVSLPVRLPGSEPRAASYGSGPMANRDGNGWTTCGQGHRHWGRFGAAGLLAWAPGPGGGDAGAAAAPELVGQPRRHLGTAGRRAGQPRVGRGRRAARGRGGVRAVGRRGQRARDPPGRPRRLVVPDGGRRGAAAAAGAGQEQRGQRGGLGGRGRRRRAGPAPGVRGAVAGAPRRPAAADDHRRRGQRDGLAAGRLVARPRGRGPAAPRSAGRAGRRGRGRAAGLDAGASGLERWFPEVILVVEGEGPVGGGEPCRGFRPGRRAGVAGRPGPGGGRAWLG